MDKNHVMCINFQNKNNFIFNQKKTFFLSMQVKSKLKKIYIFFYNPKSYLIILN